MLSRIVAQRIANKATALPNTKNLLRVEEGIHTTSGMTQMAKGEVYQKQPVKLRMEQGKTYKWCACGLSSKQPFCDGSHKNSPKGIIPMPFVPSATKEYELCNCKQSDKRPLCDGIQCKK